VTAICSPNGVFVSKIFAYCTTRPPASLVSALRLRLAIQAGKASLDDGFRLHQRFCLGSNLLLGFHGVNALEKLPTATITIRKHDRLDLRQKKGWVYTSHECTILNALKT